MEFALLMFYVLTKCMTITPISPPPLITGGLPAFYTGALSTMIRDVPGSMGWFGAYEVAKITICQGVLCIGASICLPVWLSILSCSLLILTLIAVE